MSYMFFYKKVLHTAHSIYSRPWKRLFVFGIIVACLLFGTAVYAQTSTQELYDVTNTPVFSGNDPLSTVYNTSTVDTGILRDDDPFLLDRLSQVLRLGAVPLPELAGRLINVFLSLLTIIFVFLMLSVGAQLLFSGGNEERTASARRTFVNAIIGLILILASYSIVRFLLQAFVGATSNTVPPSL